MPDLGDIAARAAELAIRLPVAMTVIAAIAVAARLAMPPVRWFLDRRRRPSYTRVLSGLFRVAVVLIGCLFSLTLAFPRFESQTCWPSSASCPSQRASRVTIADRDGTAKREAWPTTERLGEVEAAALAGTGTTTRGDERCWLR